MTATFLSEWLNLLFRWFHLIVGVGWIGTSFYFIALDLSLRRRKGQAEGILGSAWEVHGGGFYHVEKFMVAPKELPKDLMWYKWDAYLTWVSGFALLIVQYYYNATVYLIDPEVMKLLPAEAVAISIASLGLGWIVYDRLCRSAIGKNIPLLALCLLVIILGATYGYSQVFSGRGVLIHVGALIGTFMAFNVFMVIIPNQKKITADLLAGRKPDAVLGRIGKQRSVHNNYLTLPVLLMMVSGHYPLLTGHSQPVLVIALILVMGGMVRHFINRHDAQDNFANFWWALPAVAVSLIVALIVTQPVRIGDAHGPVLDSDALKIARTHCSACHSASPTNEAFTQAPKNIELDSIADLLRYDNLIMAQAVRSSAMPLGNETGMTRQEREILGAWLQGH